MKISELLQEKAPPAYSKKAQDLFVFLASNLNIRDGKQKDQNRYYDETGYYPIRVMPTDKKEDDISDKLQHALKSPAAKKAGIKFEKNAPLMHSAKFSSALISYQDMKFGVVLGAGSNKGEDFEKELLKKMNDHLEEVATDEEAAAAFAALEKADKSIKLKNIKTVRARKGSTKRSESTSAEETGKIIADIIIEMKNGTEHYVSVKDPNGATVANFGVTSAFNNDLTVNDSDKMWTTWIKPFGIDAKKVGEGLQAYRDDKDIGFDPIEKPNKAIGKTLEQVFRRLWGSGYIYLRKTSSGFDAKKIDSEYLDHSLKGLKITEIRYPDRNRKQITVFVESPHIRMIVEIRNPSGQIKPKDLKMKVLGKARSK